MSQVFVIYLFVFVSKFERYLYLYLCLYLLRECKFSSLMQVANRGEGKVPATDYHVEPPEQNCPRTLTLEFGISLALEFGILRCFFSGIFYVGISVFVVVYAYICVYLYSIGLSWTVTAQ